MSLELLSLDRHRREVTVRTVSRGDTKGGGVYYESRKRELMIRLMNEGRCDERLKARVEEST